jgi:hypothetical protein
MICGNRFFLLATVQKNFNNNKNSLVFFSAKQIQNKNFDIIVTVIFKIRKKIHDREIFFYFYSTSLSWDSLLF